MDINLVREAVTVLLFLAFVGIVVYAAHPANRERFETAARLPLDDDGLSPQPSPVESLPQRGPRGEGANDGRVFAKLEHR